MNQINSKIYGLLGLSTRAGKLIFGTDAVKEAILKRKIKLVIIAEDCSEKSKQSFIQFCEKMDVEYLIFGNILENSKAIGKENKAILGLKDIGFAESIKNLIYGGENIGKN